MFLSRRRETPTERVEDGVGMGGSFLMTSNAFHAAFARHLLQNLEMLG